MFSKSKKLPLVVLFVTAVLLSRTTLLLFNDPEGPNLLIVMAAAFVVYVLSLASYALDNSVDDSKKFGWAILIQFVLVIGLYFVGVTF